MGFQAFRGDNSFSNTRWISGIICAARWHSLRIQGQLHLLKFTSNLYLPVLPQANAKRTVNGTVYAKFWLVVTTFLGVL
jgi:hypothetical protein